MAKRRPLGPVADAARRYCRRRLTAVGCLPPEANSPAVSESAHSAFQTSSSGQAKAAARIALSSFATNSARCPGTWSNPQTDFTNPQFTSRAQSKIIRLGTSQLLVPLKLNEERTTAIQSPPETSTGVFLPQPGGPILTILPLPIMPPNVAGFQRHLSLEVRQTMGDDRFRPVVSVAELKLPWIGGQLDMGSAPGRTQRVVQPVRAVQESDMVKLVIGS